jgi:hypothetical protein
VCVKCVCVCEVCVCVFIYLFIYLLLGHAVAQLVEELRYKYVGGGFESGCYLDFPLT